MKIKKLGLLGVAVLGLAAVVPLSASAGGAQHVSWAIIHVSPLPLVSPLTFTPGGVASAHAPDGRTITLTGSGTFVAPPGGSGGSGAVTGGGTWTTSDEDGGTYKVVGLVSWELANFQAQPPAGPTVIDNTGNTLERANGTAVLRIEFSDGELGVLTVGCHGPGAPSGMFEGIATTKSYTTYYAVPVPGAADTGRTIFHVR